jgi:hypothetical protein
VLSHLGCQRRRQLVFEGYKHATVAVFLPSRNLLSSASRRKVARRRRSYGRAQRTADVFGSRINRYSALFVLAVITAIVIKPSLAVTTTLTGDTESGD